MAGETDLDALLAGLDPVLHPEVLVFATVPRGLAVPAAAAARAFAVVEEAEATTVIVPEAVAGELGLDHEMPSRRIELRVHSDLAAVGLTAAISTALAAEGIPANVVAAFHHDHVLVPADRAEQAMGALRVVGQEAAGPAPWVEVLATAGVSIALRPRSAHLPEDTSGLTHLDVRVRAERSWVALDAEDLMVSWVIEELIAALRGVGTGAPGSHEVDGDRGLSLRFTSHGATDARGMVSAALWVTPSGSDPAESVTFDIWDEPGVFAAAADRVEAMLRVAEG